MKGEKARGEANVAANKAATSIGQGKIAEAEAAESMRGAKAAQDESVAARNHEPGDIVPSSGSAKTFENV